MKSGHDMEDIRDGIRNKIKAGEWVIIKDKKIIAHHKDISKILQMAAKFRPDEIIISKEPSSKYCFY
jgi:hypothetical protein